ncbi:hypothetical protein B0H14DRAFT_2650009 [Mycena olivaceomarginata]|nr:hypothetical protein B0H14DRAFT_2650009 [Mycena olivaceomarginata]
MRPEDSRIHVSMGPEAHDTDILELEVIVNTHDDLLAPEGKVSEYTRAGSAAPKLRRYLRVHVGARMVRFDRITTSLNTRDQGEKSNTRAEKKLLAAANGDNAGDMSYWGISLFVLGDHRVVHGQMAPGWVPPSLVAWRMCITWSSEAQKTSSYNCKTGQPYL